MAIPTDRTVGFIGLGRMGEPIVRNLLAAGVPVVVFDIDRARCALLKAAGATVADSNAEVARNSAISFTMVMNDAILRSVVSGPAGILSAAGEGHLWCDLSTVYIGVSEELAELAARSGVQYLWVVAVLQGRR